MEPLDKTDKGVWIDQIEQAGISALKGDAQVKTSVVPAY
jgi:hypothetical protein